MTLRIWSKFCSRSDLIYIIKDEFRRKLKQCASSGNIHLRCLISFCNLILSIFYYFMIAWIAPFDISKYIWQSMIWGFTCVQACNNNWKMFVFFPELAWGIRLFMCILVFELLLVLFKLEKIKLYNLLLHHTLWYRILCQLLHQCSPSDFFNLKFYISVKWQILSPNTCNLKIYFPCRKSTCFPNQLTAVVSKDKNKPHF